MKGMDFRFEALKRDLSMLLLGYIQNREGLTTTLFRNLALTNQRILLAKRTILALNNIHTYDELIELIEQQKIKNYDLSLSFKKNHSNHTDFYNFTSTFRSGLADTFHRMLNEVNIRMATPALKSEC